MLTPHARLKRIGLNDRKAEEEIVGPIGLVAMTIRVAIEDAYGRGRFESTIGERQTALPFFHSRRFNEMVSEVGADPDTVRGELLRRLPWLKERLAGSW